VRGLRVSLPKHLDARTLQHVRENLWLVSYVDDDEARDPSIRVPVGPLFFDFGQTPKAPLVFRGTDSDGDYFCFLAMPHGESIRMSLLNKGILPIQVETATIHEAWDARARSSIVSARIGMSKCRSPRPSRLWRSRLPTA